MFRNEHTKFGQLYPKTLYMVRDPRDVVVSYFHHYKTVTGSIMTIDAFVREYVEYGHIRHYNPLQRRWDVQLVEWVLRAKTQRVKFVRYEDLLTDRPRVLREVCEFMAFQPKAERFNLAVERGTFEAMRSDEKRHGAESYPNDEMRQRGSFIRKGQAGGWREELTPDLVELIAEKCAEMMDRFGYNVET